MSECIEWTGARKPGGYGWRWDPVLKRANSAHRIAWREAFGDPGDQHVLHRCDNPPCVNTDHLYLGTHDDNMTDVSHRMRGSNTKLTWDQVRDIRASADSDTAIAARYGVARSTISMAREGRTWKDDPR